MSTVEICEAQWMARLRHHVAAEFPWSEVLEYGWWQCCDGWEVWCTFGPPKQEAEANPSIVAFGLADCYRIRGFGRDVDAAAWAACNQQVPELVQWPEGLP